MLDKLLEEVSEQLLPKTKKQISGVCVMFFGDFH